MKKEWVKPEVSSLGMENTNEVDTFDRKYRCQYCREKFEIELMRDKHEKTCFSKPPVPGGELPDMGVTPIS